MSKSIMIVWAPGHCGLSGSKLADHQAKLSAAETQPNNTESSRPPFLLPIPIKHVWLKEVCTSLPDEQIKTSIAKTECTDLACFSSSHHPAFRLWQHLVGISEDADCRLCGEEVELAEHSRLQCPALMVE